jgi:hypothetical protein
VKYAGSTEKTTAFVGSHLDVVGVCGWVGGCGWHGGVGSHLDVVCVCGWVGVGCVCVCFGGWVRV